jgi:hypothetical protein
VHFRESADQLAQVFAQFGLAHRLAPFERGKPLAIDIKP